MTINAISSQNLSEVSFGKKHDVEKAEKKHHEHSKETTAKILTALARQLIAEQRLADIRKMDNEIAQSEARVAPKFHQMKQKTYEDMFKDLPDTGNLFEKDLPVMKRSEFMERYSA